MNFEFKKHYSQEVKISGASDGEIGGGIKVDTSHWSDDRAVRSIFKVRCGPADIQVSITANEARDLSAMLLIHAEQIEQHQAQFEHSKQLQPA